MNLDTEFEHLWEKGYVVVRNAFTKDEMSITKRVITHNERLNNRYEELKDETKSGQRNAFFTIFVWNDTSGDDVFSVITRSYKIFDRLEFFFKDEVL